VRPERLQYTRDSGVDGDPAAFEVTVTFEETSGKTKVTMRSPFSIRHQQVAAAKKIAMKTTPDGAAGRTLTASKK
jgi:Activator of Hsp90 ATPase homolog 1-like protein